MNGAAPRSILVTGATGLVGTEVSDQLRACEGTTVVGVSRRDNGTSPDLVSWRIGVDPPPTQVRRHWDVIVNTAASTQWTMSRKVATIANVASVRALRPLASADTHFIQVSTAFAVGLSGDAESADPADYRNSYEWSKAQAEQVARDEFSRLTIVRPPLLVGRRIDGRAARFSGMYTLIRGLTASTVPVVVGLPHARMEVLPVDDLGRILTDLALDEDAGDGATLTLGSGRAAPTVEEALTVVLDALNGWRLPRGHQTLERPRVIPGESWHRFFLPFARRHLTPRHLQILDLLRCFEPYLEGPRLGESDRVVDDPLPALESSTRFWADTHPRLAALQPWPWRNSAQGAASRLGADGA